MARFIVLFPPSPSFDWADASGSFLAIVILAALSFFVYATIVWSFGQALSLFAISVIFSTIAETLGLNSGVTFGSLYSYNVDIEPTIAAGLPVVIPLAWFVFCCIPLILLRPWLEGVRLPEGEKSPDRPVSAQDGEAPHARRPHSGSVRRRPSPASPKLTIVVLIKRVFFCSLLLASSNLFLEPLFVYTKSWTWHRTGVYFGAPLTNLFGWFLVGLVVYTCFFYIQRRWFQHQPPTSYRLDYLLIGLFLIWVFVALLMINETLNSLTPLALTVTVLGPSLWFRVIKDGRIREFNGMVTSRGNNVSR